MTDAGGLPAHDRLTLRYTDVGVEREFADATADGARRRLALAAVVNVPAWVIGAILAPIVLPAIDARIPFVAAVTVISLLVAAALWALRPRSRNAVDRVLFGLNVVAGTVLGVAVLLAGLYAVYGAFFLLFGAVNGLAVQRLPFVLATVSVVLYEVQYVLFATAAGVTDAVFQAFLLGSAFAILCSGNYMVESAERRLFAQARVIADLHRQVNDLFHRYLSPDVADSLLSEPERVALGGEEVEVTVLFADLTGFTTYSEQVEPADAVAMLNEAFAAAIPVVREAGGTVVQFAGDAMMVIWNAPGRQPDHARRACAAALGLQRATAGLAADPAHPRFRVGVNTGPALVGNVGTDDLRNFTAIGDTTNLAARLQTFAPPGSVAVGPRTWELVEDVAECRDLGPHELKGKAEPVRIRELLAIRDATPVS